MKLDEIIKEEPINYDDLPKSSYSGASTSSFVNEPSTEDPFKTSTSFPVAAKSPVPKRRKSDDKNQTTLYNTLKILTVGTISTEDDPFDYEDLPISSYSGASRSSVVNEKSNKDHIKRSTTFPAAAESPASKKRKSDNTSQMTPFEFAMLEIERDRTEKLTDIAMWRLEVTKRMAAENAEFHSKILALMKSKK